MKPKCTLNLLGALFALFCADGVHAYFETTPQKAAREMNGIKFETYSDFTEKWKLVTVRFREDSKELRLTYANDVAWKGLKSLKPDFADGAIFAKIAFATEDDAAFVSSKVPTSTKRFQFMVKDKKKYKETEGWGYALFNAEGDRFSDDEKTATLACAACHRLVPERDYVFSRLFSLGYQSTGSPMISHTSSIRFTGKKVSELSILAKDLLASEAEVESLEGELQKNGFSGTLDEIVPILIDRSKKLNRASILALNASNFTLVKRSKEACTDPLQRRFRVVVMFNGKKVRDSEACQ